MAAITAAIAVGLAVTSSVVGMSQQRKAAKQQRRANETAQRQENFRAQRERLQAVRSQRIANASAINQGAVSGMSNSSMVQGGISAFNANTASNMAFTNQMNNLTMQRMNQLQAAERFTNRANTFGQISQLGFTVAGMGGDS